MVLTCNVCGRTFATSNALAAHINNPGRSHQGLPARRGRNRRARGGAQGNQPRGSGPPAPAAPPAYAEVVPPGSTKLEKVIDIKGGTPHYHVLTLSGPPATGGTGATVETLDGLATGATVTKVAYEFCGPLTEPTGLARFHLVGLITSALPSDVPNIMEKAFAAGGRGTHDNAAAFLEWPLLAGRLVTDTTTPRYLIVAVATSGVATGTAVGKVKLVVDIEGAAATGGFPAI